VPVDFRLLDVNGWPALITLDGGELSRVLLLESDGVLIHGVFIVLNPDKLQAIRRHLALTDPATANPGDELWGRAPGNAPW
jgi:hypothetical protein